MPFAGFEDFKDCVRQNSDKTNPEAYCAALEAQVKVLHKNAPQQYTLGLVYEPGVEDAHGDFMTADTIEKAAHEYMRKLQGVDPIAKMGRDLLKAIAKTVDDDTTVRVDVGNILEDIQKRGLNDMHQNTDQDDSLGEVVESFIAPTDMTINGQEVRKGSWLVGVIWNEAMFQKIRAGERTGFSLEGVGRHATDR